MSFKNCCMFQLEKTYFINLLIIAMKIIENGLCREVYFKARSLPASLALIGQVTMHTTEKWPIVHPPSRAWRSKVDCKCSPWKKNCNHARECFFRPQLHRFHAYFLDPIWQFRRRFLWSLFMDLNGNCKTELLTPKHLVKEIILLTDLFLFNNFLLKLALKRLWFDIRLLSFFSSYLLLQLLWWTSL